MLTTTTAELAAGLAVALTVGAGTFAAHRLTHTSPTGRHPGFTAAGGFGPGGGGPRRGYGPRGELERPAPRRRPRRRGRGNLRQAGGRPRRRGLRILGAALTAVLTYWAGGVYLHTSSDVSLALVAVTVAVYLRMTMRRGT